MGGIYAQIRQRQCRALTLCCCHKTTRVCVATSCGARFIQFRFHAMESAWSMACVILPQTRAVAIACAVLLASLWFEVSLCRVTNQIKSPQGLKLRGWEFHRRVRFTRQWMRSHAAPNASATNHANSFLHDEFAWFTVGHARPPAPYAPARRRYVAVPMKIVMKDLRLQRLWLMHLYDSTYAAPDVEFYWARAMAVSDLSHRQARPRP